jgi:hypothetical protein
LFPSFLEPHPHAGHHREPPRGRKQVSIAVSLQGDNYIGLIRMRVVYGNVQSLLELGRKFRNDWRMLPQRLSDQLTWILSYDYL